MYLDAATYWGPDWTFSTAQSEKDTSKGWKPATPDESSSVEQDLAVAVGEPATIDVLENEYARQRLVEVLNLFRSQGFSMNADQSVAISEVSRCRSVAFLSALPRKTMLPRVAPDGEQGVVMIWDKNDRQLLLTLDEQSMHCVQNAGTLHAIYHDDLHYDGVNMPQQVVDALASL